MNTLAWHDGGPGPWILFLPLVWAGAVAAVATLLRRGAWRGRPWEPRRGAVAGAGAAERSPMAVLGRRFAAGEIDEDEYWRRMSVLEEHFGRGALGGRGGGA